MDGGVDEYVGRVCGEVVRACVCECVMYGWVRVRGCVSGCECVCLSGHPLYSHKNMLDIHP